MKALLICASAIALFGGQALADEVIIHKDAPDGVVSHRSVGPDVETKKVIEHDGQGCDSKTVTKSDGMGDSKSKTVTNC